jgi:hypothetical protein
MLAVLDCVPQEYPIHLMAGMGDKHQKLEEFLSQWNVIMSLFDDDYSYTLLNYWVKVSVCVTLARE